MSTYSPPPFGQPDQSASGQGTPPPAYDPSQQVPYAPQESGPNDPQSYPQQYAQPAGGYPPQQAPYSQQVPHAPQAYPGMYSQAPQTPKRNQLVFVVSILLLVGAAINLFNGFGMFALLNYYYISTGLVTALIILAFGGAALLLVAGILGIMHAANPAKAGLLVNVGIGLIAFAVINAIITIVGDLFSYSTVTVFLLPILFLVGALTMKKQA